MAIKPISQLRQDAITIRDETRPSANTSTRVGSTLLDITDTFSTASKGYPPYIGEDGFWYVFDAGKSEYVNTKIAAQGPKGDPGDGGVMTPVVITGDTHTLLPRQSITRSSQADIVVTIDAATFTDGADAAFLQVGAFTPVFTGIGVTVHYGAGWDDVTPVEDGITVYAFQRIGTRILINRLTY